MENHLLNLDKIRVAIENFKSFHGDGVHRAALRAKATTDANGFVFDHHRTFGDGKLFGREVKKFVSPRVGCGGQLLCRLLRKFELAEWDKLQTVFRTDIDAAAAEDALAAVRLGPFKNGVDPALKTTGSFSPGLLFRKASFDLGYAGAAFERNDRHSQTGIFVVLRSHLMVIEERDLYIFGLGLPLGSPNKLVDFFGGFFAIRDGIDDQARTKGDIPSCENSRRGGHKRRGIDSQGALPRGFEAIGRFEESQIRSLPNGENYRVARNNCFRALGERGTETPLSVEYRCALDHFEAAYLAIVADELLRAKRGMDLDPLNQALFNLFFRSGHFLTRFEAHEVHFTSAHA